MYIFFTFKLTFNWDVSYNEWHGSDIFFPIYLKGIYKIIHLKIDGGLDVKIDGNLPSLPSLWSPRA